jgi:hypothetical protein
MLTALVGKPPPAPGATRILGVNVWATLFDEFDCAVYWNLTVEKF